MALRLVTSSPDLRAIVDREHRIFAAKMRAARAILGWSQSKLAARAGLTQRAVHKLEQGETEPRRATEYAIEHVWRDAGIAFESVHGGYRLTESASVLDRDAAVPTREGALRFDAGVTAGHRRTRGRH